MARLSGGPGACKSPTRQGTQPHQTRHTPAHSHTPGTQRALLHPGLSRQPTYAAYTCSSEASKVAAMLGTDLVALRGTGTTTASARHSHPAAPRPLRALCCLLHPAGHLPWPHPCGPHQRQHSLAQRWHAAHQQRHSLRHRHGPCQLALGSAPPGWLQRPPAASAASAAAVTSPGEE
jgi:hypothetical protein